MELSPLDFMLKSFPNTLAEQGMRRILGVFGCSGMIFTIRLIGLVCMFNV